MPEKKAPHSEPIQGSNSPIIAQNINHIPAKRKVSSPMEKLTGLDFIILPKKPQKPTPKQQLFIMVNLGKSTDGK